MYPCLVTAAANHLCSSGFNIYPFFVALFSLQCDAGVYIFIAFILVFMKVVSHITYCPQWISITCTGLRSSFSSLKLLPRHNVISAFRVSQRRKKKKRRQLSRKFHRAVFCPLRTAAYSSRRKIAVSVVSRVTVASKQGVPSRIASKCGRHAWTGTADTRCIEEKSGVAGSGLLCA